ncbi:MAG: hypothetical protein R6W82_03950 [bacterium]
MRGVPEALLAACLIAGSAGEAGGQLPEAGPDPFAISVGGVAAMPGGNLAQDDPFDGLYATPGPGLVQRFSWSPLPRWGVFFQASFPSFGADLEALERDFPLELEEGRNRVDQWDIGIRMRGGRSWQEGPFLEVMGGPYRARTEFEVAGEDTLRSQTGDWSAGVGLAAGWAVPIGPAFALESSVMIHQFEDEDFVYRWFGIRILAVVTFGGRG